MKKYFAAAVFLFLVIFPAFPAFATNEATVLPVAFTSQAPFGDWSWPWGDFCEEASVVMAYGYMTGKKYSSYEFAVEMLRLAIFELQTLGYEKDTNLSDTIRLLTDHYKYKKARIVFDPTSTMIKNEILRGNLVIAPAAGQLLGNPHFRSPGPRYHMVVIKGFDHADFIVNEPGTRFGNGWRYSQTTLMNAIHDFVPMGDIKNGQKAVIVVEK